VAGRNRWPLCRECLSPIPPAPVAGRGGCRLLRERISRSHVPFRHLLPQRWLCCGPDVPPSAACHRAGRPSGRVTLPGSPQVLGRRKGPGPGRSPLSAPGRSPPSHETPHISTWRSGRADRLSGRAGGLSSQPAPQGRHQGARLAFRRAARSTAYWRPRALHSATRGADAETSRVSMRVPLRDPRPRSRGTAGVGNTRLDAAAQLGARHRQSQSDLGLVELPRIHGRERPQIRARGEV
jgi:hypothetical protein